MEDTREKKNALECAVQGCGSGAAALRVVGVEKKEAVRFLTKQRECANTHRYLVQ